MSENKDKSLSKNREKPDKKNDNENLKTITSEVKEEKLKTKPPIITREEKDSLLKLPFILLANRLKYTKPLIEALKLVYNWTDSTPLTKDELTNLTRKWLHNKVN